MIAFLLKLTISISVLYLIYKTLLAKENNLVFKRYFLLAGILLSVIISLVSINVISSTSDTANYLVVSQQIKEFGSFQSESNPVTEQKSFSVINILLGVYLLVSIILLFRYIINIVRLIRSGKQYSGYKFKGYKIKIVEQNISPFSFMNTLFISKRDYTNENIRREILIHELAHIKQHHSIDILMIEFLQVILWFNPFVWLYKKEISLNHEYLADRQVVHKGIDTSDYQNFILNYTFRNNSSYLASNLNYSFIKKRFIMLTKEENSIKTVVKGLIALPLVVVLAVILSFNQKAGAMEILKDSTEWWVPILERHHLKADKVSNNFENVFEMADENVIKDGISISTNAILIMKGNKENEYVLIETPLAKRNLNSGVVKLETSTIKFYKMDSDSLEPETTLHMENGYITMKEDHEFDPNF